MNHYPTVVFDLDGTLLDPLEDLKNSVNFALRECGMPERTKDDIRRFLGNGMEFLMERAVPQGREHPQFERACQVFREYYSIHCNDNTCLYNGVKDVLEWLRRHKINVAIVSNKPDFAVQELREIYFNEMADLAVGEKTGISRKPAPDMVEHALKELNVAKETAVYVGDSEVDIRTAANSGLPCISVTWGFRDEAFLRQHGASLLAHNAKELCELL